MDSTRRYSAISSETAPGEPPPDLWAAPLAGALDRTGGFLLEGAHIPHDLVDAALADLPAA
jgi:hypothetical protein